MRKYLIVVLVMVFVKPYTSLAQINLVPNPSFEDTISCPYTGLGGVDNCDKWYSCKHSPDYWTDCNQIEIVPNTGPSYQFSHSGTKMIGVATYATPKVLLGSIAREIAGVDLIQSTQSGSKYFFSMFINQAYKKYPWVCQLATNRIGVKLTSSNYTPLIPVPINNSADYYDTLFHSDTAQWINISGSFISNGSFSKLMIGNFFDDANTDTMNLDSDSLTYQYAAAYYFIDDVCLSTDSLYAATWTGIKDNQLSQLPISLSPNPANSSININGLISPFSEYRIIDIQGKVLQNQNLKPNSTNSLNIDIAALPTNMYIIQFISANEIVCKKFIKE